MSGPRRATSSGQLHVMAGELDAFFQRLRARFAERRAQGRIDINDDELDHLVRLARLEASDLSTAAWRAGREVGRAEGLLEAAAGESES